MLHKNVFFWKSYQESLESGNKRMEKFWNDKKKTTSGQFKTLQFPVALQNVKDGAGVAKGWCVQLAGVFSEHLKYILASLDLHDKSINNPSSHVLPKDIFQDNEE